MVPIIVALVWLQVVTMIIFPSLPPLNRSLRGSHFDASLFQTPSRTSRYLLSWMIFQRDSWISSRFEKLHAFSVARSRTAFTVAFTLKSSPTQTHIRNSKCFCILSSLKTNWENMVFPTPPLTQQLEGCWNLYHCPLESRIYHFFFIIISFENFRFNFELECLSPSKDDLSAKW